MKTKKTGFTLIELSIVIIIIAILSAAVFVGQDLLQNAKENTIISDFQKFKLYTDQFREKYEGYPGDLSDATTYFGEANTNNGNGDNIVNTDNDETYLAWQHLAFADFIEGTFTGNKTSETVQPAIGFDVPESPISATPYIFSAFDAIGSSITDDLFSGNPNFIILVNLIQVPQSSLLQLDNLAPSINPNSAYNIDLKADDGVPTTGLIYGFGATIITENLPDGSNCFTDNGIANSKYIRNIEEKACFLLYDLK
jgi:prepilin-type N-terminal cleavage/methylation domain-containing protein